MILVSWDLLRHFMVSLLVIFCIAVNAVSKRRNLGLMTFGPRFQSLGSSWWERHVSSSDPGGRAEVVHTVGDWK